MEQRSRQAAHVWVDVLSVATDETGNDEAIGIAWDRFNDIGAITGELDEDEGVVTIDGSQLLRSAVILMDVLAEGWSRASGLSKDEIVLELRRVIDAG